MKRREAREFALKILYQMDIKGEQANSIFEDFWDSNSETPPEIKEFAEKIALGTEENLNKIDNLISSIALNWKLERMGYIDRNILRMAAYEIFFLDEIPPVVSINEAIEIAKIYGTEDSPKFINGILNKIKEKREKNKK